MIEKKWIDSIYKYIAISDDVLNLTNCSQIMKLLTRLSEISQIGLAHKIFPSATHTKFQHNLEQMGSNLNRLTENAGI
jgi:HD superfamily phosphohydrolase